MRKVVLDRAICLKAGQCFYLQPSVFRADSEGWPEIIVEELDDETFEVADSAAEICPSGAIEIVDE
jgi:ferredoxin|tara:strand:+ start:169 stop:366 length:198 start_codon:yes stop_codon:yes gene_type:complete